MKKFNCIKDFTTLKKKYINFSLKSLNGYNWQTITRFDGFNYEIHHADTLNNFNFSFTEGKTSHIVFCSIQGNELTINKYTTIYNGSIEKNYQAEKYLNKFKYIAADIYNIALYVNGLNVPAYDF